MDRTIAVFVLAAICLAITTQSPVIEELMTTQERESKSGANKESEWEVLELNSGKRFYYLNNKDTWINALELCHANGRVAATISAPDELGVLAHFLKYTHGLKSRYFWTSGHDLMSEGNYVWFKEQDRVSASLKNKMHDTVEKNCLQINGEGYLFDWECRDDHALPLCQDI